MNWEFEHVRRTNSYFTMLFNFILCDIFRGLYVDEVLFHLLQLGSFHKKLQEGWEGKKIKTKHKWKNTSKQRNQIKSVSVEPYKSSIWQNFIWKCSSIMTLYLSPSPFECRKYLLISWVRTDTGLLTFGKKQGHNDSITNTVTQVHHPTGLSFVPTKFKQHCSYAPHVPVY